MLGEAHNVAHILSTPVMQIKMLGIKMQIDACLCKCAHEVDAHDVLMDMCHALWRIVQVCESVRVCIQHDSARIAHL